MAGIFDDDRGVKKTAFTGQRPKLGSKRDKDKKVPSVLGIPLGDPRRATQYQKGEGINSVGAEFNNFLLDTWRGAANLASDSADFANGRRASSTQLGNRMFGQAKASPGKSTYAKPDLGPARPTSSEEAGQEMPPELSFADYLRMANELSGGGTDYSALMNQLRTNAGEGDARLNAMYSQLQKSFADDAAGIGTAYDEAAAAQQAATAQTTEGINAGYDRARAAQTQQFRDLGIEDAAATIAASGATAAGDQAFNTAQAQQLGNINQQQTQANKAGSLSYNTKITQAAGAEGASQRAQLQQQLQNKLAELEVAQSEDAARGQDSMWERASFLADWDNAAAQRRAAQMGGPSLEDQLIEAQIAQQHLKNEQLAQQLVGGSDPGTSYAQVQKLAQQAGIDPSDQEAMGSFIEQLASSVKLY